VLSSEVCVFLKRRILPINPFIEALLNGQAIMAIFSLEGSVKRRFYCAALTLAKKSKGSSGIVCLLKLFDTTLFFFSVVRIIVK